MCIAIYKPENTFVKKAVLENCFKNHSDGAGFMVHDHETHRLIVKKGLMTFKAFWKAYSPYKSHRAIIHFRFSTHGETNAENTHPFQVSKNLAFVHNGVINIDTDSDKTKSDTWHFNESIIKPIIKEYPTAWRHKTIVELITHFLDKKSKLVFMDNDGNVVICNEELGTWEDGSWFSNDTYKKEIVRKKVTQGTTHYSSTPHTHSTTRSQEEILLEQLMQEAEEEELAEMRKHKDATAAGAVGISESDVAEMVDVLESDVQEGEEITEEAVYSE